VRVLQRGPTQPPGLRCGTVWRACSPSARVLITNSNSLEEVPSDLEQWALREPGPDPPAPYVGGSAMQPQPAAAGPIPPAWKLPQARPHSQEAWEVAHAGSDASSALLCRRASSSKPHLVANAEP
jgi:hypothetical protein